MINNLNDFNRSLGEVMMYAQFIDHDIKEIYLNILGNGSDENADAIKMMTLGETLLNIQEFDIRRKLNTFSIDEYLSLKQITKIRNYYAHSVYSSFAYTDDEDKFKQAASKLESDIKTLADLQNMIEEKKMRIVGN